MATDSLRAAKGSLRAELLARRSTETDREGKSAAIVASVSRGPAFVSARTVFTYVGVGSEVDTIPLVVEALRLGKSVAVPVVEDARLGWFTVEDLRDLVPGRFGLLEPLGGVIPPGRRAQVRDAELLVIPGVGFDRRGGRLGYGRGYYDRVLAAHPSIPQVATGFCCQVVPEVPMGPGDVRIRALQTEAWFWQDGEEDGTSGKP